MSASSSSTSPPKPSTGANNVQLLLRFLAQDAKLPLSVAMSQAAILQKASLGSPEAIANSKLDALTAALTLDPKQIKQIWNAAKRVSKKRQQPEPEDSVEGEAQASRKKRKGGSGGQGLAVEDQTQEEIERALALPEPDTDVDRILHTVLITNRAPLLLAFTVVLLEYTMPEQPLSSRLSLAQAVVSTGAQKQARSLGLEKGPGADEEGWGAGQPVVRIMGRDISVMRRGDYEPGQSQIDGQDDANPADDGDDGDNDNVDSESREKKETQRALDTAYYWGLDLEALKKSNGPPLPSMHSANRASLPIYHAASARNYLYKSFGNRSTSTTTSAAISTGSKKTEKAGGAAESEKNLALLLGAIRLLYDSWKESLDPGELDRRAFGWYIRSRPDVDHGIAGWGGRGEVSLKEILALRREATT